MASGEEENFFSREKKFSSSPDAIERYQNQPRLFPETKERSFQNRHSDPVMFVDIAGKNLLFALYPDVFSGLLSKKQ